MSSFRKPGKHATVRKYWRALAKGKEAGFFLEHEKAVLESLDSEYGPRQVLLSNTFYERRAEYWESLASKGLCHWYLLEDKEFQEVTTVVGPAGICGVYEARANDLKQLKEATFVLATWEVQDPGNLGTLLRSLKAFSEGCLLAIGGCKPWSSKVARASAGALLRSKVLWAPRARGLDILKELGESKALLALVPRGGKELAMMPWEGDCVALLGNETRGLPKEVVDLCQPVTIGMEADSESLNVAVAGSLLCYQRASSKERLQG